jgi:hypothetical protein
MLLVKGRQAMLEAPYYTCPLCNLTYDEESWAQQCEAWCREHQSCNLAITAYSREVQERRKRQEPSVRLSKQ